MMTPHTSAQGQGIGLQRPRASSLTATMLAGLAVVVYANTLANDFAYDDIPIIVNNPAVHEADWRAIWLHGYWSHITGGGGNYRPLTVTTFALDYWLWGLRPFGYHLTNVLLHAANVAWLFYLLRRYRVGAEIAGLTGLLFAVHPVHTEAVANVVGRAELLGMFFGCLMWWAWLKGASESGAVVWCWRAGAATAYLAAVLSKENMIVLPAALLIAECLAKRPYQSWRRSGWTFLLFTLALGLYFRLRSLAGEGLTQAVEVGQTPLADRSFWERAIIMAGVGVTWYRLALVGYPLQIHYGIREFNLTPVLHWRVAAGLAVTVGLIGLAIACRRRAPLVTFAVAFWFITLAITSNILLPIGALLAERWLYLPSAAASLGIATGVFWCARKGGVLRVVAPAGVFVLLVFYVVATVQRNRDWRNNVTLFESLVAVAPNNPSGYMMLGHELMEADPQRARVLQEAALRLDPEFLSPQGSLAELDLREGRAAAACERFAHLLAQEPKNLPIPTGEWADWHALYAKALALTGDLPAALEQSKIALRQSPESEIVLFETSQVFLQAGHIEAALDGFRRLTVHDRDHVRAYGNLATVLIDLGRYAEAEEVLLQGLRLAPNAPPLEERLAFVRRQRAVSSPTPSSTSLGALP
ncbi:MAG: tetratricopeptide repeat protein [Chloracidobacterium sp.]|nr:tetratricopeptide repeat protein [Chloracidobacterium sp.]MDW8216096.1 tetratricopeptide repeat protein [Acidobacteriota bacterium]